MSKIGVGVILGTAILMAILQPEPITFVLAGAMTIAMFASLIRNMMGPTVRLLFFVPGLVLWIVLFGSAWIEMSRVVFDISILKAVINRIGLGWVLVGAVFLVTLPVWGSKTVINSLVEEKRTYRKEK